VVGAQTPATSLASDPVITFDQALHLALSQSAAIKQAENANSIDATSVKQSRLAFLPNLSLSASTADNLGRNFSESEGRVVDQTTQSVNGGLSSSITLFDGFKNVANLRSAQKSEDASSQDLQRAKQTVVFNVASNFVVLVSAQEQLRVQQENLKSQQALEDQIQKFVNAGVRPISDLYQQQAQVASTNATVVDAQRAVELAKVDLIQTLQLDPRGTYEFAAPTVNTASSTQTFDLDALLAKAFTNRLDLTASQARVEAAQQDAKAANASRLPTVSLSAGYSSSYNTATDLGFADQLDQRRGGSVGLSVSIPLFDRGNASLATERAQLQEENARLALANARQNVALEVRRAYLDFRSAQQKLAAAQAQQKAADLAVQTSQERYRVGAATLVEVTQARATQVQAASALVSARYNLVFQQALMSYYTGELDAGHVSLG
jgi:outer membrane protein